MPISNFVNNRSPFKLKRSRVQSGNVLLVQQQNQTEVMKSVTLKDLSVVASSKKFNLQTRNEAVRPQDQ